MACHLLPPNVILRKYAPSIYEDAKIGFNSTEEDKRELVADALERAFNQFNQELVDRVLSPLSLDQRRNHYLFLQFVKHVIIVVSFTYQM